MKNIKKKNIKKTFFIILATIIITTKFESVFANENLNNNNSENFTSNFTQNESNNQNSNNNNNNNNNNNDQKKLEITQDDSLDDLDSLSMEGEKAGIKIEAPAQRSFLMNCLAKFGVTFFLMPYIKVVNGYRKSRDFLYNITAITWNYIAGKKEEPKNNKTNNENGTK